MTPTQFATIRTSAGLSQNRLADLMGVTHGAVSRWEAGSRAIPKLAADWMNALAGQPVDLDAQAEIERLKQEIGAMRDVLRGLLEHRKD